MRVLRVLVQPMIEGVGEALVGYRVDPGVGPLVMVAAGGILTEIYRDRSLRLAPVDIATAQEMIAEVRGLAPLAGYRGRPKGDLDALAQAIVALSKLAGEPAMPEAEINPLIVRTDGRGRGRRAGAARVTPDAMDTFSAHCRESGNPGLLALGPRLRGDEPTTSSEMHAVLCNSAALQRPRKRLIRRRCPTRRPRRRPALHRRQPISTGRCWPR